MAQAETHATAYNRGDYEEAEKKAKTAKTLALVGLIGGGIIIVAYIIMMVAAAGAGALQTY
ncbi:MAG: CD225/dispanin family protein [Bacteroidales bacterium]|nr:CD225/dispanin family protein [Bacteroidales bacterium]